MFHQAGRGTASKVLKSPEFEELKDKAEVEIAELRKGLNEKGELLEQVNDTIAEFKLEGMA